MGTFQPLIDKLLGCLRLDNKLVITVKGQGKDKEKCIEWKCKKTCVEKSKSCFKQFNDVIGYLKHVCEKKGVGFEVYIEGVNVTNLFQGVFPESKSSEYNTFLKKHFPHLSTLIVSHPNEIPDICNNFQKTEQYKTLKNHYSSEQEKRKAFLHLIRKLHPDKLGLGVQPTPEPCKRAFQDVSNLYLQCEEGVEVVK